MDVIYLNICGIILGIPYLYDRKSVFFQHENKYHLTKDGVEYIMRAHGMKDNSSLVTTNSTIRVVNANKNLVLIVVEAKYPDKSNDVFDPYSLNEVLEMGQTSQWGGKQQ